MIVYPKRVSAYLAASALGASRHIYEPVILEARQKARPGNQALDLMLDSGSLLSQRPE